MPATMAVDTVGMAAMVMLAEATAEMGAEAAAMEAEVAAAGLWRRRRRLTLLCLRQL